MSDESTTETRKSSRGLRWVFIGPQGIRAGWSMVLFLTAMFGVSCAIALVVTRFHIAGPSKDATPDTAILAESVLLLMVAAPTAVMALIERRSVLSYGFIDRKALSRFACGFGICIGVHSVQVLLMVAGGWVSLGGVKIGDGPVFKIGALSALGCLMIALFEEAFFRGYALHTLARGLKFWWAAAIMSILFGAVHLGNSGYTWVDASEIALSGFVLALSLRVTGSLYWAVGFHAAWDWFETYVVGVADGTKASAVHLLVMRPGAKWQASGTQADSAMSLIVMAIVFGASLWLFANSRKKSAAETL